MSKNFIAGLEIGTSRTVLCIGESKEDGSLEILGIGTCKSAGIRKGQVIDLQAAKTCAKKALAQASELSDINIWDVFLAVSCGNIQCTTHQGFLTLRNKKISRADIDEVEEIARESTEKEGYTLLHTLNRDFSVDDQSGIIDPLEMQGEQLRLDVLSVYTPSNRLQNLANIASGLQLNVQDTAFSALCASGAVLSPEQKMNGVLLIDLGGGTTNFTVYRNNMIQTVGSRTIGGDHVTNDIAIAFQIGNSEAEEIKRSAGSAIVDEDSAGGRVEVPTSLGFDKRTINRRALHTVINARMSELFEIIRSDLQQHDIDLRELNAGIVLTGGGAYLQKICTLAESALGLPCRIGEPQNVRGLQDQAQPASLATAVGLLMYGQRTLEKTENQGFIKIFKGLFGK